MHNMSEISSVTEEPGCHRAQASAQQAPYATTFRFTRFTQVHTQKYIRRLNTPDLKQIKFHELFSEKSMKTLHLILYIILQLKSREINRTNYYIELYLHQTVHT